MFSKRGDGRSFDKFGISQKGSPMDFSGAQKLWKDAAPLNGKTFSSTISRLSIKRWRILFDFPLASVLPLIFTFSFLLLRLTWNPWIETGVTVRRSVTRIPLSLYILRVSPLSLHIPHIFPRVEITPTGLDCLRRFAR